MGLGVGGVGWLDVIVGVLKPRILANIRCFEKSNGRLLYHRCGLCLDAHRTDRSQARGGQRLSTRYLLTSR
jgi:hypothetical protein